MDLTKKRCLMLAELAAAKNSLGLSQNELERVDEALSDRWGVDFIETSLSLGEYVAQHGLAHMEQQKRFAAAHEAHSRRASRGKGGEEFYAAICEPGFLSIVTASRRPILIDSISVAATLIRATKIDGKVLDVGCHAGIADEMLSNLIPNEIWGIDPCAKAIETARARLSDRRTLTFLKAGMPWTSIERFEFVLSIDSMPKNVGDRAVYLKGIADILVDGGVALIVSQWWGDIDITVLQRQLKNFRLGYGLADVVGGLGDMPTVFVAEGCLVLVKNASDPVPRKLRLAMERDWMAFSEYANDTRTADRYKTQAFKRAVQVARRAEGGRL